MQSNYNTLSIPLILVYFKALPIKNVLKPVKFGSFRSVYSSNYTVLLFRFFLNKIISINKIVFINSRQPLYKL